MTTTVTVEAHCASNKEVVIETDDGGTSGFQSVIQDGGSHVTHAYDARKITVYEREKAAG